MARVREPHDWERDLSAARATEAKVAAALSRHPLVTHFSDYSRETEGLDFEFRFEGSPVRVDVKEKRQPLSRGYCELWPEVPPPELFVLDETAFRSLMWAEGLGYLVVHDVPGRRWLVLGPWEIALGPRRRFERRQDKGAGEFTKGKLLVDLRTASARSPDLSVDELLAVVKDSRRALRQVEAIRVRGRSHVPVVPSIRPARDTVDLTVDPAWAGLASDLVAAVQDRWGWERPTPAQALAFPHVLAGSNVLILAPTAGGKTEAALLPVVDLLRHGSWARPSVVMISPLKALLADQLPRYRRAAALIGATVFAWHGDVGRDERREFRQRPTDILLTTPESLEQLLSRPGGDGGNLLSGIRVVIVDEVHTFAGTARGGQLAALLERLEQRANGDIQRIGLSATVGEPRGVLQWLAGSSLRDAHLVEAYQPMQGEELSLFSYASTAEAASLIGNVTEGHKALVFAPSRRRAEQLAHALGADVHHSSVAAEGRSRAVRRLMDGTSGCVVATASLEMGIDIGDIDLVVNDGAPSDPGSYLQRLGRAGRRSGNRRMILTVGEPDSLLLSLAVIARARRGDLDAIPPRRGARLVLGQQILALAFEQTAVKRGDIHEYLCWSPVFRGLEEEIESTITHLLGGGWLVAAGEYLVAGPTSQSRFGGVGFIDLLATFEGTTGAAVVDSEGTRIGSLDWSQVIDDSGEPRPEPIVLAGRPWTLVAVDRSMGTVTAIPAAKGRAPSWRGPTLEVGRRTWETAREILLSTEVPADYDDRAAQWLEKLRRDWVPRLQAPVRISPEGIVVDAFAGTTIHQAALRALPVDGRADGPSCELRVPLPAAVDLARAALDRWELTVRSEAQFQSSRLSMRHKELCAPVVLLAESREYHVDQEGLRGVLEMIARTR